MVFGRQRTRLKNRIHSVLDKYGLQDQFEGISDIFGKAGRDQIERCMELLPPETRYTTVLLLELLDVVQGHMDAIEKRMRETFEETDQIRLLKTMPGVGFILGVVISLEIGDIDRFYDAPRLSSYCGVTPRVHASGDKIRYGRLRPDVNRYLKWAFSEAGNSVAVNRKRYPDRHVSLLYNRIRHHRGHAKAIGAVARHLSEAAYWVLKKRQPYYERGAGDNPPKGQQIKVSSRGHKRVHVMSP